MAFKDGMLAISKTLKVIAIALATVSVGTGLYSWWFTQNGFDSYVAFLGIALFLFLAFWTPAWIIRKFAQ